MRIVKSLHELKQCPNCLDTNIFAKCTNEFGREYLKCQYCGEEIYENETTCYETITRKQELAVRLEDIIHDIPLYGQNHSQLLAYQKICEAFGEIIKYLEE